MLTALILICSLSSATDAATCTEQNAVQVLRSPETFANPVACLMHGQAYLANSAVGRDLNEGETVKVICKRIAWSARPRWKPPTPTSRGRILSEDSGTGAASQG
jgi:hypothetical protein